MTDPDDGDDSFFASEQLVIHRVDWEYGGFLLQRGTLFGDDDPTLPEEDSSGRCTVAGNKALCRVGSSFTEATLVLSTGDAPSGPLSEALEQAVTGATTEQHRITLGGRGTDLSVSLILNDGPLGVIFIPNDLSDQPLDLDVTVTYDPGEEAPQVWRITPALPG